MNVQAKQMTQQRIPAFTLKKVYEFFENCKAEFLKVQWTEGQEVWVYAKLVVFATFFFGLLLYVTDLVIHRSLMGIEAFFRLILG